MNLCTYRLYWAKRTSWGWWDDTVLQTQDSKFEPWRSEAENATSRSRRLPTILTFTRGWGRNIFCFFQTGETGNRTPNSGVKGSGVNHYPRAPLIPDIIILFIFVILPSNAFENYFSRHFWNNFTAHFLIPNCNLIYSCQWLLLWVYMWKCCTGRNTTI